MTGYPTPLPPVGHTAPVPRRIRGVLDGVTVVDTTSALYVWEWSRYPHYYLPVADVEPSFARLHGATRPGHVGMVRVEWTALDAWFEEDEQVFVHARDPYVRVDALRSTRHIRVELDGVLLAESTSPVLVFETGLPTRYYLNRTDVDLRHLEPSTTVSECPYKGTTTDYWSVRIGEVTYPDLAWAYDFPTRQLLPITGLVCFYNEKVDVTLDGVRQERPVTHFA